VKKLAQKAIVPTNVSLPNLDRKNLAMVHGGKVTGEFGKGEQK
jgi:hypothetical protein